MVVESLPMPSPDDWTQRALVIFGAGSGIGLAAAELASVAGAQVTIADIDPATADLTVVRSGQCTFAKCDVTSVAQVKDVLLQAARRHNGLDGVVTTVGGAQVRTDLAPDIDYWTREIAFNMTSAYIVASAAIMVMREAGHGSVVTTSSSYGQVPGPDRIAYSSAKAGVLALTRSLAAATARTGIRVNCVAPGATDTPRFRRMSGGVGEIDNLAKAKPQGRIATTEEVAHAILFLLSDAASSITGQVIHVNNGSHMP
jgi:3-oxoacyl-[acyl-carrier protein] reductase